MAKVTKVLQNPEVEADADLMRATLERYGVTVPKRAGAKKLAEMLRAAYKKRIEENELPEDDWIQCPVCKEITDDDEELDACPFCGDLGEEEDDDAPSEPEEPEDDEDDDEDDDAEPEPIETEDPDVDDDETEEPPTADVSAPEPTAAEKKKAAADKKKADAAAKKKAAAEKKKADAAAKKKAAADKKKAAADKKKKAELAKDARPAKEVAAEIMKLNGEIVTTAYEIGLRLREVKMSEAWRAEGFKSFREWHTEALGYGAKFANGMINAVRVFKKADFEKIGHSKLMLIANVSDPEREKLKADAAAGASKRELEQKTKAANAKDKGSKAPIENDSRGTPRGGKAGRPKKEDQTITLIGKVGGKPKVHRFHDKDGAELKEWSKDSFAAVKISDGVIMYVALKTNRKGDVITGVSTMFKRVEEAEPEAAE